MCKRIISLLLCLCILCCLPISARAAEEKSEETEEVVQLTISSLDNFLKFAEQCQLDSFSQNLQVILTVDLDLTGADFHGIPMFCGQLDGNSHSIKGLSLTQDGSAQGLFRYLSSTATVQDLHVIGMVKPGGSASEVGGIVGNNAGKLLNCSFTGSVSGKEYTGGIAGLVQVSGIVENCKMSGTVYGDHFVGGIAGSNNGVIRGCENEAKVNDIAVENTVELTDITLNSITSSEAANTVTDVGGIAGHSMGVIRECVNRGNVGYQHMGYNIGGIAGTQSGALLDCENHGEIRGRKEAGGIVGQLEPTALIEYEEDALQILKRQLNSMGSVVNETVSNVQGTTDAIVGQVWQLKGHVGNAQDAVDSLIPDKEDPNLPDLDTVQAAKNTISSSISGMTETLKGMNATVYGSMGAMSSNLYALQSQINAMRTTLGNVSETLGGTITDVSDQDTDADLTGKVAGCVNYAPIQADRNVGGIVGAIAMENDLDITEDWSVIGENSLNFESQLRAVVLGSNNTGKVTCGKQNAGGIVGWQSMGLVRSCLNSGVLDAEAAEYVGGISGQSLGYIRSCWSKCEISGDLYTGGIAGSAVIVTDCRSMTVLDAPSEKVGEVMGIAEENHQGEEMPVSGNYYLSVHTDRGAIDGISYAGQAEPASQTDFLALENLPDLFRTVSLRFRYANGQERTFILDLGEAFDAAWIPQLPPKIGYTAVWKELADKDLSEVLFDMSFEPEYISKPTVLEYKDSSTGIPQLLLQGLFEETAVIHMTTSDTQVPLEAGESLLESWDVLVTGAEALTQARLRLSGDKNVSKIKVLVRDRNDQWTQREHTEAGSYLLFAMDEMDQNIALVQEASNLGIYIVTAASVLLVLAVCIVLKRKEKKYPYKK